MTWKGIKDFPWKGLIQWINAESGAIVIQIYDKDSIIVGVEQS